MHISIRASLYGILALLVLTIGGLGVLAWTQLDETLDLSVQAQEGVQLAHIRLAAGNGSHSMGAAVGGVIQQAGNRSLVSSIRTTAPLAGTGEFIHSEEFAALLIELQASFLAMDQPHRDLPKSAQDITNRLIESNYSQDAGQRPG